MALRSVEQYKAGLRDDRKVFVLGKRVADVTADPHLKVGVETACFDFALAHDDAHKKIAVMEHPTTGEPVSAYFKLPDQPTSVAERYELVQTASYYADSALPFVKDVGTDLLNGMTAVVRGLGNQIYIDRLDAFRWDAAQRDVALAGVVTDVKGDRSKGPSQQSSPDYYLRVVDETADEIVVSGAKAHITASAYVDELIVIPTRAMTEADADCAVAFAVPANTAGITHVARPLFNPDDTAHFPTPKPHRGHLESLVMFDNVRVPKERVFLLREWQAAQFMAYAFSAFHRFTAVTYKIPILEYLTGLGLLVADANGISKASHVKDRFVDMIRYTETTKALAKAALASPENFGGSGLYVANPLIANMAKLHFASGFHQFISGIQDLAGGLLVTQPTYPDWENEELRPQLERYLGGAPGFDAEKRLKLMSLMHHVFASDFAGWHEVCTIHAEGSTASQKMMLLAEAPIESYKKKARELVGLDA